ncbi:hypothetical protein [Deinococcus altitudinis]|uniref:hypothetical protein n=1 Tax=Deinococcus altitudinis TaxID=468914 RepID=UPI003891528B
MSRNVVFRILLLSLLWLTPARADTAPTVMKFSELYSNVTVRGIEFSPKLTGLAGKKVTMTGFMAPPLKPKLDFFVLTKAPMSSCPFCTTSADWPPDIVLVIMPDGKLLDPSTGAIRVTGRLEVGIKKDEQTGFVSLVRVYADRVEDL